MRGGVCRRHQFPTNCDTAVKFVRYETVCPKCGGPARSTSSPRPIRYMKCTVCGKRFKAS